MAELCLRDAVIGDAGEIARIHVASWRAAYRGLMSDAELDGLSVDERAAQWRERLVQGVETLVAVDQVGDRQVGDRQVGDRDPQASHSDRDPHANHSDLGDAVVGFCALRRETGPPAQPVEIGALYLDPARLREGIGTRLLDATLARLRAAGEPVVTLWVLAGNVRARAFYVRHGFSETGESGEYHGAAELRMALVLAS